MQRWIKTMTITLPLLLTVSLAHADVYKCSGASGRPQYQNVPCDNAAPVIETQPTSERPAPAPRVLSSPPVAPPAPPAVALAPEPSAQARRTASTPLDTKAFGMLTLGMSAATVRARVGEPDDITDNGKQMVGGIGRGRIAVKEVQTVTWTYFGDSQTLDSFLTFADGVLVTKEKAAR